MVQKGELRREGAKRSAGEAIFGCCAPSGVTGLARSRGFTGISSAAAPWGGGWIGVTLKDGRRGYVAEQYIWSPVGYRAIFDKNNGKWTMTALIAGD